MNIVKLGGTLIRVVECKENKILSFKSVLMHKQTFEDLEIWKMGMTLINNLGSIFYAKSFRNFDFQSQIMRACMSVTNNIAEGFERFSQKEFILFLYYAKGSCGEVRSMLYSAKTFGYIEHDVFESLRKHCVILSVKIYNLILTIKKNSKKTF